MSRAYAGRPVAANRARPLIGKRSCMKPDLGRNLVLCQRLGHCFFRGRSHNSTGGSSRIRRRRRVYTANGTLGSARPTGADRTRRRPTPLYRRPIAAQCGFGRCLVFSRAFRNRLTASRGPILRAKTTGRVDADAWSGDNGLPRPSEGRPQDCRGMGSAAEGRRGGREQRAGWHYGAEGARTLWDGAGPHPAGGQAIEDRRDCSVGGFGRVACGTVDHRGDGCREKPCRGFKRRARTARGRGRKSRYAVVAKRFGSDKKKRVWSGGNGSGRNIEPERRAN